MLKKAVVVGGLCLWCGGAVAQQPTPPDPALAVCQQLLSNANGQTIQVGAQGQNLARQVEDLKAELARLKAPPAEEKK